MLDPENPDSGLVTISVESVDTDGNTEGNALQNLTISTVSEILYSTLTEQEIQDVKDGKYDIAIKLTVTFEPKSTKKVQTDKKQIESYLDATKYKEIELGDILDITLQTKKSNESDWNKITNLDSELEITVDIPEQLKKNGRIFYIVRNHDGECTLLDNISKDADKITFKTDRFSTYAIAYSDTAHEESPKTGQTGTHYYWILLMMAGLGISGFAKTQSKKKKTI